MFALKLRSVLWLPSLLVILLAGPAASLDFADEDLVYLENFDGESAFPTTPELDLDGAGATFGGAVGVGGPVSGAPALSSGGAHVQVFGAEPKVIEYVSRGMGDTGIRDLGLRTRFSNLLIQGDGTSIAAIEALFLGSPVIREIDCNVAVVTVGGGASATFEMKLRDDTVVVETDSFALGAAQTNALLAGVTFTLDLFIDRSVDRAFATLTIDGQPAVPILTIDVSVIGSELVTTAVALGGHLPGLGPLSVKVRMDDFSQYASLRRSYNVDFGASQGTPSPSYAAAGSAGTWNTVGTGTSSLVDTDGLASGATVTLTTQFDLGNQAGGPPDAGALFGDHGLECGSTPDTWSVDFAGLVPGRYRVYIYAPAFFLHQTGDLDVNGIALPTVPGDTGFGLIEGTSWIRVSTATPDGTLSLSGEEISLFGCAGIAGVQLDALPPEKVPSVSALGLTSLAMMLVCGGALVARRRAVLAFRPRV